MSGIAAYCPSASKVSDAKEKYLVEQRDRSGIYTDFSDEHYVIDASDRFLRYSSAFLGVEVASLDQASHELKRRLREVNDLRCNVLKAGARYFLGEDVEREFQSALSRLNECCRSTSFARSGSFEELSLHSLLCASDDSPLRELDKKLDTTLRYFEFWLAVHYYECEWLAACRDEVIVPKGERWKTNRAVQDRYWRYAPALTPCFVMTEYQVPKYFEISVSKDKKVCDYGRVDLLITDEAGQVSTPVALASFAFAKRAVVVGDTHQLSPIWSFEPEDDELNAADCWDMKASDAAWKQRWEAMQAAGLTGSHPSSVMRVATHSCAWRYSEAEAGLFLEEHYRCVEGIIECCNKLVYQGRLHPCRHGKSKLAEVCEPFLFKVVGDSKDERAGSSRRNPAEARAIAEWIVKSRKFLEDAYDESPEKPRKSIEDIVAVVTPFSAQAGCIRKALRGCRELDGETADAITVGTAHRLQGAERPVVLFSLAYGENSPAASFVDANPELMNVAISRAKDVFIVFGADRRRFDSGEVMRVVANHAQRDSCEFAFEGRGAMEADAAGATRPGSPVHSEGDAEVEVDTEAADDFGSALRSEPVSLSTLLRMLNEAGAISKIKAKDANLKLKDAGLIEQRAFEETGKQCWCATRRGLACGILDVVGTAKDGSRYTNPRYTWESIDRVIAALRSSGE